MRTPKCSTGISAQYVHVLVCNALSHVNQIAYNAAFRSFAMGITNKDGHWSQQVKKKNFRKSAARKISIAGSGGQPTIVTVTL